MTAVTVDKKSHQEMFSIEIIVYLEIIVEAIQ